MIQTIIKDINGSKYEITQFTARRALRLQARLIKALGPFLFELSSSPGKAIQLLAESVSENELESLAVDILSSTRKSGMELTPAIIDMEFAGDLGTLYEVCKAVLEVNFENFWKALGIGKKEGQPMSEPQEVVKKVFTRK